MRNQLPACPTCGSHDVLPLFPASIDSAQAGLPRFTCNSAFCRRDGEFTA